MVRANIERILGNPPRDESIPWPPLPELETLTVTLVKDMRADEAALACRFRPGRAAEGRWGDGQRHAASS